MNDHDGEGHLDGSIEAFADASTKVITTLLSCTTCAQCQLDVASAMLIMLVKVGGYSKQQMLDNLALAFDSMQEINISEMSHVTH